MCDIPFLMSFMIYKKCISLGGGFCMFFYEGCDHPHMWEDIIIVVLECVLEWDHV